MWRSLQTLVPSVGMMCLWLACATAFAELPRTIRIREDFERGKERWTTTQGDASRGKWSVIAIDREGRTGHALRVSERGDFEPPHRSPYCMALLKDVIVGDFELTCRVQNTNKEAAGHRDLCLFWGYQDPAHFYYVHLGSKPDPHSCQIFIVDGADRTKITKQPSEGTPWTDGWHTVKVVRRVADGTMEIYFDDMKTPTMTAQDNTFAWGQVGLGTFDDHGNFDDVVLKGTIVDSDSSKRVPPQKE